MTTNARGGAAIALVLVVLTGLVALVRVRSSKPIPPAPSSVQRALRGAGVPAIGYATATRDRDASGGLGAASAQSDGATTGKTAFEAASIGKLVVAVSVLQLVEQRRLDLDADVGTYVGFPVRHPRSAEPITLRRLLTHRGGLRDEQGELLARRDTATLGAFLATYVHNARTEAFLEAPPGSSMSYSNVGVSLAALAVERVSGESFDRYAAGHIFAPLRMDHSSYRDVAGAAAPHALRGRQQVVLPQPSHAIYPVIDLRASAHDLARFGRAILREGELDGARVLTPASVQAMLAPDARDPDQALAWQLRTIGGRRVAGHEGEDEGASTMLFLDRSAGTAAVVLANGDAFRSDDHARIAALTDLVSDLLSAAAR